MYEMIIIGAGPAGISMAAEARGANLRPHHLRARRDDAVKFPESSRH